MIRAGRRVVTQAHLARRAGSPSLAAFRMARRHLEPGHPSPVSSAGAQRLLWDDEQTAAYYAGAAAPALPEGESGEDLLDKYEAAELVGVSPETWRDYQKKPARNGHPPLPVPPPGPSAGEDRQQPEEIPVDHWHRDALREWIAARPGPRSGAGGRPKGVADLVDRQEIVPRAAALLADNPDLTGAQAADHIGIALATAQNALATARADAVEQLLKREPGLTTAQVTDRLGYPRRAVDRAWDVCAARRRATQAAPYLAAVAEQLTIAGHQVTSCAVRVRPGGTVAAALRLEDENGAGARYVLWDERYGWRTAPAPPKLSRPEATPPTGAGIRYLARAGLVPGAEQLQDGLLRNPRSGSSSPTVHRSPGDDLTRHLPQQNAAPTARPRPSLPATCGPPECP